MSTLTLNSLLGEIKRVHDNEQSGVLVLTKSNGERVDVVFREGMVEAASSSLAGRRLGDYLGKEGFATVRDLDTLESLSRRKGILFGEAVVGKGFATQGELSGVVRLQAIELLDHAFRNGFTVDSFESGLRTYHAAARITFPNVLLELCRRNAMPFESGTNVQLALRGGIDFSLFHWYPQELHVLSELQYSATFERLLNTTGFQETNLKKVLGVFDELGIIE